MRRIGFIFLFALMLAHSGYAQSDIDVITKINGIKLDSLMLYGEFTGKSEPDSKSNAIKELKEFVEGYRKTHDNIQFDSSKVEILEHLRGNNVRVFAYVHVDSLLVIPKEPSVDIEKLEKRLISMKNWTEVSNMITDSKFSSLISCGHVDLTTDDDILNGSYIFVAKGADKRISEIYSPCLKDKTRRAMKSGTTVTSISFRQDDKVYWLNIK